jgi:hypothetical protein
MAIINTFVTKSMARGANFSNIHTNIIHDLLPRIYTNPRVG